MKALFVIISFMLTQVKYQKEIDLSACMFCFPNSDHVMFSREFVSSFFINYAYIYTCMYLHGVPSRGLKWEK